MEASKDNDEDKYMLSFNPPCEEADIFEPYWNIYMKEKYGVKRGATLFFFLYIYIQITVISVIIYIIYNKNRNKEQPDDTTHNNLRSVEQQPEIRYTCTEKPEKISEKIFKIIFKKR